MHPVKTPASQPSVLALALCAALATSACSDDECLTDRQYFGREVWSAWMSTDCFKCHSPDGVAVANKARFVLQPPTYPGFLDANLASIREIAKNEYEGKSLILLKPLGEQSHGGGKVLEEDSEKYESLVALIERLKEGGGDSCGDDEKKPGPAVELLSPPATLRKATVHLSGRLPTADELAAATQEGMPAVERVVDTLMKEPAFLGRLDELFNDVLLTDSFRNGRRALDLLNTDDYPEADVVRDTWDQIAEPERRALNDAVAREPLRLMRWVVENDLPFTEILTADYVVVDDALARVYKITDGKTGLRTAKVKTATGIDIPHAGLLSTPAFLNRYPTTPTNRSRARARVVLKTFLATDILKIADRPIDITQVTAKDNPTRNHEACSVCHRVIDPIAGGFRGWDERDYEKFRPDSPWHDDMVHPGFGTQDTPSEKYGAALQWLAAQMAGDQRFDLAVVQLAWKAVTGRGFVGYPEAGDGFDARLAAWERQDELLQRFAQVFRDNGRRFRPLVKAIVTSDLYRAARAPGADAAALTALEPLGTARLLAPEVLNRKIVATTGVHWRMAWDWEKEHDWLLDANFALLYGGIDSTDIVERATAPNGVMSNLAWRMASETACFAVPYDFAKPAEQRLLFPYVRLIEVPESAGHLVPGAIENVKRNLVYLHERLLGETLAIDSPEIEASYQVFLETWREGQTDKRNEQWLSWPCGRDPTTGAELAEEVRRDRTYVVRAWMAALTYLLADYRFLYE